MQCVVGFWPIVLASSSILYGKVPRLILKKTRQADAGSCLFSKTFSVRLVVVYFFIGRA